MTDTPDSRSEHTIRHEPGENAVLPAVPRPDQETFSRFAARPERTNP